MPRTIQGENWTEEYDKLLVETVIKNVSEGKTLLSAFKDMEIITEGAKTERAAKFRWHTKLKEEYAAPFEIAKQEGKQVKGNTINQGKNMKSIMKMVSEITDNPKDKPIKNKISVKDITTLIEEYSLQESRENKEKISKLESRKDKEISELRKENAQLKEDLTYFMNGYNELKQTLSTLQKVGVVDQHKTEYKLAPNGIVEKK